MKKAKIFKRKSSVGSLKIYWKIALVILPLVAATASLCIGRISYPAADVVKALWNKLAGGEIDKQLSVVLFNLRMPRILLALLAGAGLSVAGCAFQSLFANPLATPDTLGVASGASFGAALAMLLGFGMIGIQTTAFVMGIVAVALTWTATPRKAGGMNSVVLAGIMIGSLFSALVSLVKFVADTETQLPAITYWLMGSLSGAGYDSLKLGAPFIIGGIAVLYALRWRLNILPLSDDEAKSLGSDIRLLRAVTVICATAMTASCVSMCGQVGWVGLLVPHMCRMAFGNNMRAVLPASVSIGATFMVITDTLARSISASPIPTSVLTAIIGAPFFIALMRKNGGWSL